MLMSRVLVHAVVINWLRNYVFHFHEKKLLFPVTVLHTYYSKNLKTAIMMITKWLNHVIKCLSFNKINSINKSPLKHFSGLKIMQQKSYGTFHGVQEQENVSYLQVDTAGSNNESTGGLNTQCKTVKISTKISWNHQLSLV